MIATTATHKTHKAMTLAMLGVGILGLPFLMPAEAKADDFKISLNLGGAPYSYNPPVQRVVYQDYRPAPQRIVYVQQPRRVVYVSQPVYSERIVYRDWDNHRGRGNGHGHGRWDRDDGRGNRVAWR